jgi:hypothetical protein
VARTLGYAFLAVALIIFGFAGLFSIGAPFLLTGLVMLICFPWRHRRTILWPALAGVWGFTAGYILVAPLGCTQTGTSEGLTRGFISVAATTTCNGAFFDYSGGASYNPPLLPAVLVGIVVAVGTALAVRALISKGSRDATLVRTRQMS